MAEVIIEARPNGPYVVTGTIELRDTNGNVYPPRPGPCSVAAVHPRKSPSATEPTQRSASKPRHKRCLTRLKALQAPALRGHLQETSECPPQRWTPLNLTESSPASIRPTLKRQKAPVRRSNPRTGRGDGPPSKLDNHPVGAGAAKVMGSAPAEISMW